MSFLSLPSFHLSLPFPSFSLLFYSPFSTFVLPLPSPRSRTPYIQLEGMWIVGALWSLRSHSQNRIWCILALKYGIWSMTAGGNCPVHTGDYSRRFRRKRFSPENGDYSRQCGRGFCKPSTVASEKIEVVAIWYSLNLLETTLALFLFVTHSALYADLQLTHFLAKNYDLLPESGTAQAYSSRPTFKSGTAPAVPRR